jgi:hypothetical protein
MEIYVVTFLITIFVLVIRYFQSEGDKQRISEYLLYRGATNIIVSSVWFDMDKTTRTYDVEYTSSQGTYCRTSCKIRTGFFSNGEIYWRDPP